MNSSCVWSSPCSSLVTRLYSQGRYTSNRLVSRGFRNTPRSRIISNTFAFRGCITFFDSSREISFLWLSTDCSLTV